MRSLRNVATLIFLFFASTNCLGQETTRPVVAQLSSSADSNSAVERILNDPAPSERTIHSELLRNPVVPKSNNYKSLFLGLQGAKQPQDFGVNANFGGRAAGNFAYMFDSQQGLGLQLGWAIDASANAVQVFETVEGTTGRTQYFSTVGLFQKHASGWDFSLAHDFLVQQSYDSFFLSQWRAEAGHIVGDGNRLGVRAQISATDDNGAFGTIPVNLRALDQCNVFYSHQTQYGSRLGAWIGAAESHGERNLALGDGADTGSVFVWGAEFFSPLNSRMALVGQANFITPADTGTVDAFLGIEYTWGQAIEASNRPFLPVASSPTFSVDLRR